MAINKRLLVKPPSTGITPSEHFGVVLYEGDGSTSHSINGGKFGAGAYFNGGSSFDTGLSTTNFVSDLNDRTVDFSFSCWAQIHSYPQGDNTIFYIGNYNVYSPSYAAILLDFRSASKKIRFTHQTQYIESTSTFNSPTGWVHVVGVRESSVLKLYINGSLEANVTLTADTQVSSSTTLDIGGFQFGGGTIYSGLEGKIDQVRVFQKALSSSEVSTLYAETAATVESLDPLSEDTTDTLQVLGDTSCIATYRFENNEDDLSGNYDLTGRNIQYAAGRYGQAASFTGTNASTGSALYVSNNVYGSSTSVFSVSLWVKCTNTSGQIPLSGNGGTIGGTQGYAMFLNSGSVALTFRSSNGNEDFYYGSSINDNSWHHLVLTFNNGPYALYLDGEVELSGTTTNFLNNTTPSFDTYFGNRWNRNESGVLAGEIDQVRVFNKAISASEATTLYNENPLVASYRFEGNANDDTRNYDGNASNVTYEYGLNGFTPDFVWIKNRVAANSHNLYDTTRGATKLIESDTTDAEITSSTGLTSFDTGGFTVSSGSGVNNSTGDYVAWCWKAGGGTTSSNTDGAVTTTVQVNEQAGFSIVEFSGTGSETTFGHGLGEKPDIVIIKRLNSTSDWPVYHDLLDGSMDLIYLNSNGTNFNSSRPLFTSSVFYFVTSGDYIAYAFHSVEGFSSFGSYTGNGSTNGPIIETGFEPAFLMVKRTDSSANWRMVDNKRSLINPRQKVLFPNLSNAEFDGSSDAVNFLSNGFQIINNDTSWNASGGTYIYMAFAADPDTEAPTVAKSFSTVAYTGNSSTQSIEGLGFSPNLVWIKGRNNTYVHGLYDTIRGSLQRLRSNGTEANENVPNSLTSFDSDGFTLGSDIGQNQSANNYVAWAWKADDNEPTIFGGSALAVYKFEDNANDVRGNYNGTTSNITYTTGKFNKAASFVVGNSSKINFSNSLHGSSFSMSFWMKATDMGTGTDATGYSIYSAWIDVNNYFRPVLYGDGKLLLLTKYSGTFKSNTTATGLITENTWHHIVFNFTPTDTKAYVDGVNVGTFPSYDPMSFTSKDFGTNRSTPDFTGDIDQLRFYDAALTQENVTALYEETLSDNDNVTLGAPGETIISANANAGFSIVQYEGDGVAGKQVPHGLGQKPDFVVIKHTNDASAWVVFSDATGTFSYSYLNLTSAFTAYPAMSWDNQVLNLNSGGDQNGAGDTHIAYFFTSIAGYSKIGSYTGTGTTNSITGLGFQPDWLMIKRATGGSSNGWVICDSVRGVGVNLRADTNGAEADESAYTTSFDSDGFTLAQAGGNTNVSGSTYIYMAFKIN